MRKLEVVTQKTIDDALVTVSLYAVREISLKELEERLSYEAALALSKTGMVNISVAKLMSGRYIFRFTLSPKIMPSGTERLKQISNN